MKTLVLESARTAMAAAENHARGLGITVAVSVIDAGGNLMAFSRMDGTQLASSVISQNKAYTAVAWQRPSHEMFEVSQPGQSGYALQAIDSRFVFSGGGVPFVADGRIAGAIGISGGTAEQDRECAEAAAAVWDA